MGARLIDGKSLAQTIRERIAKDVSELHARTQIRPGLAAILVGDDPASKLYVKNKQKACDAAGIYVDVGPAPTYKNTWEKHVKWCFAHYETYNPQTNHFKTKWGPEECVSPYL